MCTSRFRLLFCLTQRDISFGTKVRTVSYYAVLEEPLKNKYPLSFEKECLTGAERNSWKVCINRLYLFKTKNYFYYRVKERPDVSTCFIDDFEIDADHPLCDYESGRS